MNRRKIEKDILKFCLELIFNSKYEEWSSQRILSVENVQINCYDNYFQLIIYYNNNNKCNNYLYVVDLAKNWIQLKNNKIGFIKNILLKKKLKDINNYFLNKEKNDYILKVYNSLPTKIIRKSKLEKLNK